MLEVVFSGSAGGSMRAAGLFDREDIYSFDLGLDMGDIAQGPFGPARQELLGRTVWAERAKEELARQEERFHALLTRWEQGEDLRVWYSAVPFEACGLHWLMNELDRRHGRGKLWAVQLPNWEVRPDGESGVSMTHWGEVGPREWKRYLPRTEELPPVMRRAMAWHWEELKGKNAPLRAVVNGRLASVPEDFYDGFLLEVLARRTGKFREAAVIGELLGRYQLGISDEWPAQRVQVMVEAGLLEVLGHEPGREETGYARYLRKTDHFPGE